MTTRFRHLDGSPSLLTISALALGLLALAPVNAQPSSKLSRLEFSVSQIPERCAALFAQYERFRSSDRLDEMNSSQHLRRVGIAADIRQIWSQVLDEYQGAAPGGSTDQPALASARQSLDELRERLEACGGWSCFQWEDPPLSTGSRDELDKARSQAWEGALLAKLGRVDDARKRLDFSRRLIFEWDRNIEDDLDAGRSVPDVRTHPAYLRTLAEIERQEQSAAGILQAAGDRIQALQQDVTTLVAAETTCEDFFRALERAERLSGSEDAIFAGLEKFAGEAEAFEAAGGAEARRALEKFGATYGTTPDVIQEKIASILGETPGDFRRTPSIAFQQLTERLAEIPAARNAFAEQLTEMATRRAADQTTDPGRRQESFDRAARYLALALRFDPAHEAARTLESQLASKAGEATSDVNSRLDAGQWLPHSEGFQGPGDPAALAASALAWLEGDPGWTKSKSPLAVRIRGDWVVAERDRLGQPTSWGLPVEAAFEQHADRDAGRDVAWVYSLTIVSRDAKQSPPWKAARVGSNRQMRASEVLASSDGGSQSSAPNFLFRLALVAALSCCGLLLAGPLVTSRVAPLASLHERLIPLRPLVGVVSLALGAALLFFNLLSPLSDLLPQAAIMVAGLFLGLEILLRRRSADTEGTDLAGRANRGVEKAQELLAKHESRIRSIERYQLPLGIGCLVLAIVHLTAAGARFF